MLISKIINRFNKNIYMKKKNYYKVDLTCAFQQAENFENNQCLNGVFSKTSNGFLFEEAIRKGRPPRNPKLYDGKYISMVKMQNGRYQCHIKTFNPKEMDRQQTAFDIYNELAQAFSIID